MTVTAHKPNGLVGAVLCLLLLGGCASLIVRPADSIPKKGAKVLARSVLAVSTLGISEFIEMKNIKRRDRLYRYLDSSVGKMTLDEAVAHWGVPPARHDGQSAIVLEWSSRSTGAFVAPVGKSWVAVPTQHGYRLTMTFDAQTQELRKWRYREW